MGAFLYICLSFSGALVAGRHNSDPVTACVNYNPVELTLTGGPSGGFPPYVLQWQMSFSVTGPWSDITGEAMSVFDPPNITEPGIYCISCLVTDSAGATARTVPKVITIVPDPTVTVTGGGYFCPGAPVLLKGVVTGGTGKIKYQWYYSPDGITTWLAVAGANTADYTVPSGIPGLFFYRLRVDATGSACGKPWSDVLAVLVADTVAPRFTTPEGPLCFCVEPVAAARYDPGTESLRYVAPDFYRINGNEPGIDPDPSLFSDNCCPPEKLVLHWKLEFSGGTPASLTGTGPPSAGLAGVMLPGDPSGSQTVNHTLICQLEDCSGNLSVPHPLQITIRPRPRIQF